MEQSLEINPLREDFTKNLLIHQQQKNLGLNPTQKLNGVMGWN